MPIRRFIDGKRQSAKKEATEIGIRTATAADLKIITSWLKEELDRSGAKKGFYDNINLIEEGQATGELVVAADKRDNSPIAFYLGRGHSAAILEVRPDYRQKGIGRLLMEHIIKCAKNKGFFGISGFCSPKESLPFWLKMGFEQVHNPNQTHEVAYPIRRRNKLPLNCKLYDITFKLYENDESIEPRKTQIISAAMSGQKYELEEDFVEYVYDYNALLIIEVAGRELYKDSIKYIDDIGGERVEPWLRVNKIQIR